jgi:hypothetical protein
VLAHRVQRSRDRLASPVRDGLPCASTGAGRVAAALHTGVRDDDVEPAGDFLDLLHGRAVVRFVRGRELDYVQRARMRFCERFQLRRRLRLSRARKDDGVRSGREHLGEREACDPRALVLDMLLAAV